jgi:hypothetical protein
VRDESGMESEKSTTVGQPSPSRRRGRGEGEETEDRDETRAEMRSEDGDEAIMEQSQV